DEHKLLYVYAPRMKPFRRVLKRLGVRRMDPLPLVSEAEHLHYSTTDQADRFKELCLRVGVGDVDRVFRGYAVIAGQADSPLVSRRFSNAPFPHRMRAIVRPDVFNTAEARSAAISRSQSSGVRRVRIG